MKAPRAVIVFEMASDENRIKFIHLGAGMDLKRVPKDVSNRLLAAAGNFTDRIPDHFRRYGFIFFTCMDDGPAAGRSANKIAAGRTTAFRNHGPGDYIFKRGPVYKNPV